MILMMMMMKMRREGHNRSASTCHAFASRSLFGSSPLLLDFDTLSRLLAIKPNAVVEHEEQRPAKVDNARDEEQAHNETDGDASERFGRRDSQRVLLIDSIDVLEYGFMFK